MTHAGGTMRAMDFVHLHVHSHYSLLDGAIRTEDLVDAAVNAGMKSVALTDHGNLFGAYEFHKLATKAGITPILGIEAYISPTSRQDRSMGGIETAAYHMLLLAINNKGWQNLLKLSSRSFLEGFYYRPRIDRELLAELNEGLVCCTACLGGEVPAALIANDEAKARRIAGEYMEIFGRDRFFVEIQNQGYPEQVRVNPALAKLAKHLDVKLVGTNDVHFLTREDKSTHEILTCIGTGKQLTQEERLRYSPDLYFKSQAEMHAVLSEWPDALKNTCRIAEMNECKLDFSSKQLPVFHTPEGETDTKYLSKLAWAGLDERFAPGKPPQEYRDRLTREIEVIDMKGYSSYFLIINDCVQYARQHSIPASPRGSGVATLLGYALHLSDVDPMRYGLMFERFTDPQRKEDPDIDLDFCQDGRASVIQYAREKYGHVAQIITYGTLKAKAAIRDVGRVMGIPLDQVDRIAKMIPDGPKVEIQHAMKQEPDLQALYESDPRIKELIDHSIRLEGLVRQSGVHAAGIVICDRPLDNFLPLCKQSDNPEAITQWDGNTCGKVGMMKMDFLGLRTLSIVQRTRDLIRKGTGLDVDPEKLSLDDQKVFEVFRLGQTDGVFQFESEGMKDTVMQMKPNRIEDLIAANAMYRPGPMKLIASYCNRKNQKEAVPSIHPLVDDLLAETYGVMIYQEQVMQVMNRLGKIPLNMSLTLIKAISKKEKGVLESAQTDFFKGTNTNGIGRDEASRLFAHILEFAGYGFNKAHSTRYAILAYHTAYFKVYHPKEFLAATLTYESIDRDKVVQYMAEARKMGVTIAPPDINTCDCDFVVDGNLVRFGLTAVKGVGEKAVEAIAEARKKVKRFTSLFHFCRSVDLKSVNRSTIEALIKCGAFDAIGDSHRAAMIAALDAAIKASQRHAVDKERGQGALFEQVDSKGEETSSLPDMPRWTRDQMLTAEKETLGIYVTSHPLEEDKHTISGLNWPRHFSIVLLPRYPDRQAVAFCCLISEITTRIIKQGKSIGKKMAILTLEDLTGRTEAVVFPDALDKCADALLKDTIVYITGSVSRQNERPRIIVDAVTPLDKAIESATGSIVVRCTEDAGHHEWLNSLRDILARYAGPCDIEILLGPTERTKAVTRIKTDRKWFVKPSRELIAVLTNFAGTGNVWPVAREPSVRSSSRSRFGNGNGGSAQTQWKKRD